MSVKTAAVPITKMSKAALADLYGKLKGQAKPLDAQIDELKGEFERRGLTVLEGEKFTVAKTTREFNGLKIKAIRAEMGDAWCKEREEPMTRVEWKAEPKPAKKAKAA